MRRWPIGFSPKEKLLRHRLVDDEEAIRCSTDSRRVSPRPTGTVGMPSVSRNPGEIVERTAIVRSLTAGIGRPSTAAGERVLPVSDASRTKTGSGVHPPDRATPWVSPSRSGKTGFGVRCPGWDPGGKPTKNVVMPSARKPGSTLCNRRKLSTNRTAPSSTSGSCTSALSNPAQTALSWHYVAAAR